MSHLIFAYGTLTDPKVRESVTGRKINTKKDFISGFRLERIHLGNTFYPVLVADKGNNPLIEGVVFEVNENELIRLDYYESDAYKREKAILKSSLEAWVYVKSQE